MSPCWVVVGGVLGVSIVPAIYALIYLSSVWDPNAKTSALPVALVNLDAGIHYQGHDINVGSQLGAVLIGKRMFGWQTGTDAEAARQAGLGQACVIIPQISAPGRAGGGGGESGDPVRGQQLLVGRLCPKICGRAGSSGQ
ncbi:MAG: hypothetical protein IPP21_00260 [Betaproteobacteria bacterium]|nr:hypothetical protein [Betaproteobacteria bacterium]